MGSYAFGELFFMSVTGHKYRHFRAGRNMTGSQLGYFSWKQQQQKRILKRFGSWSIFSSFVFKSSLFCLIDFCSSLSHAPALVKYCIVAFNFILLSQHLSHKPLHRNTKCQPSVKCTALFFFKLYSFATSIWATKTSVLVNYAVTAHEGSCHQQEPQHNRKKKWE